MRPPVFVAALLRLSGIARESRQSTKAAPFVRAPFASLRSPPTSQGPFCPATQDSHPYATQTNLAHGTRQQAAASEPAPQRHTRKAPPQNCHAKLIPLAAPPSRRRAARRPACAPAPRQTAGAERSGPCWRPPSARARAGAGIHNRRRAAAGEHKRARMRDVRPRPGARACARARVRGRSAPAWRTACWTGPRRRRRAAPWMAPGSAAAGRADHPPPQTPRQRKHARGSPARSMDGTRV